MAKISKISMIEKHKNLNDQDELGLQTSCIMLVRGTLIEIHKKYCKK